ncbi:MAG TPA: hypothetical protein PLQ67_10055, partial [Burkholderiaceae bacterium]|nr:hypothetical protein [Burkholderiaceae bacterium]
GDKGEGVLIRSFRLQPEATTGDGERMRYKLLVQQSGRPKKDFSGSVQLVVHYAHGGRDATLQLPQGTLDKAPSHLQLSFRHYQRVEGTLSLPAGAVARSVLVRIMSGRQVKAQQTFEI